MAVLEEAGYRGWYVLEQDAALSAGRTDLERPLANTRASLAYLNKTAGLEITS
jgi:inosose dehydratase